MARRTPQPEYWLEDQVGFILRQVNQRHVNIFMALIPGDLTPTQFSVIAMLRQIGSCSQNQLGRLVSMDAATVKGVIDRLSKRGVTATAPDPSDGRLLIVSLTEEGRALAERCVPEGLRITRETLAPLDVEEQARFLALLRKLR
ncbi:MAG: MarR family winged helix-turn-helix transcriptional regulator [Acidiphilium sp.]